VTVHRCPDCRCAADERPPQPSTSSEWARRQAIEAARQAVADARQRRTRPMTALPLRDFTAAEQDKLDAIEAAPAAGVAAGAA
jgi:hypothetical protein